MIGPDLTGKYKDLPSNPRERHLLARKAPFVGLNQTAWGRLRQTQISPGVTHAIVQTSLSGYVAPCHIEQATGIRMAVVAIGRFTVYGFVDEEDRERFGDWAEDHIGDFDGIDCPADEVPEVINEEGGRWIPYRQRVDPQGRNLLRPRD